MTIGLIFPALDVCDCSRYSINIKKRTWVPGPIVTMTRRASNKGTDIRPAARSQ